jgi:hypothetical protein
MAERCAPPGTDRPTGRRVAARKAGDDVLATWPAGEAGAQRLLQLSDLHFGREDPAAQRALGVLADRLQPDVLVVTGDLTQRATRPQFEAASRFLDRLPGRHRLVLPGNHDVPLWAVWERALTPWRRYARRFGREREPRLDLPGLCLVAVDSVRPARHQRGALSPGQIERVAQCLIGARPGQWRVVALHHPMAALEPDGDPRQAVDRADEAVRRWAACGADLVLGGHAHDPGVVPLHERVDGLASPLWAVLGGTAMSRRLRHGAPPSVNGLVLGARDLRAAEAVVQRWDFDPVRAAFVAGRRTRLPVAPR